MQIKNLENDKLKKLLVLIFSVPVSFIFLFVLMSILFFLKGKSNSDPVSLAIIQIISFLSVIYISLRFINENISLYKRLRLKINFSLPVVVVSFILGISASLILNELDTILQYFMPATQEEINIWKDLLYPSSKTKFLLHIISIVMLVPFIEELFFRGFFLFLLKEFSSTRSALFITSIIFALAHGEPRVILSVFFAGILLTWLAIKLDTIFISILTHASFNFVPFIMVLLKKHFPFLKLPDSVETKPEHLPTIVLIISSILVILSIWYIIKYTKKRIDTTQ